MSWRAVFFLTVLGVHFAAANELPVSKKSNSGSSSSAQSQTEQCAEFLDRTKTGLIATLQTRIEQNSALESCLLSSSQTATCKEQQLSAREAMDLYSSYRINLGVAGVVKTPADTDFFIMSQTSGGHRNRIARRMSTLSGAEEQKVWQEFGSQQQKFLQNWINNNSSAQFPNWRHCVETRGDQVLFNDVPGKRSLVPRFIENPERQYRKDCRQYQAVFWRNAPYATDLVKSIGQDIQQKNQTLLENTPPWIYLLQERTEGLDDRQKLALAARGVNRLNQEFRKILKWVEGIRPDTAEKLLAFKNVQDELEAKNYCSNYSRFGWNDLAEIGVSVIPGFNLYESIFHGSPLNDQAFLAGFVDQEQWEKRRGELASKHVTQALLAAPTVAGASKVLQGVGRIASRTFPRLGSSGVSKIGKSGFEISPSDLNRLRSSYPPSEIERLQSSLSQLRNGVALNLEDAAHAADMLNHVGQRGALAFHRTQESTIPAIEASGEVRPGWYLNQVYALPVHNTGNGIMATGKNVGNGVVVFQGQAAGLFRDRPVLGAGSALVAHQKHQVAPHGRLIIERSERLSDGTLVVTQARVAPLNRTASQTVLGYTDTAMEAGATATLAITVTAGGALGSYILSGEPD